jgi:regulator of replication initiation timing
MGIQASTNGYNNSFCIGGKNDGTSNPLTQNTQDNQMMMRFDNYTFWVSASNYAYLIPASNGWAYTSDINRKERLEETDGETVLQKISNIPFYSWNFKAADVRQYRHYGIMAQDFYNAFGRDSYGSIGNDTTVSPLDLLGVAYSGIKALEKRTETLQTQHTKITKENKQLKADNLFLKQQLAEIQHQFADKLALLEMKINKVAAVKNKPAASKNLLSVKK